MKYKSFKNILLCETVFSAYAGISIIFSANWLATFFPEAPMWSFYLIGSSFLVIALKAGQTLFKKKIPVSKGMTFPAGNLGAATGFSLLLFFSSSIEPVGRLLVWGIALVSLLFCILQFDQLLDIKYSNPDEEN